MEPVSKQVVSHFEQLSMMRQYNNSNNMKLGADFQLTPKTSVGSVVNGFYNASTFANNSDINISDAQGNLQYITRAQSRSQDQFRHLGGNVNMRHRFDSTGRELTADLDYLYYNSRDRMHMINRYTNAAGAPILTPDTIAGNLPQLIHIYSAKADYVHPLQKGARFEAGWKSSFVATDNNAVYDSILNGNQVRDIRRSNYFIYEEQIHAAYANYTRAFSKKLNAQLGLRMEHTAANGTQRTTGERFELNYTQLFPTAYLQYQPGEHNSFVLNYGRRIRRPDYRSLNPFVEFLDRYTFEQGNPYLRPQFSHNIELSHSFKRFLTTTLNYTQTNNIIQQVMEQDEQTNQTFVKQANIARQQQVGIAVNAMAQVNQFSGNLYVNAFYNEFEGLVNNTPIHFGAFTTVLNGSASYRFKKGQQVELSGFYRTPAIEGVMRIGALGMLNIGASTPLFKNKGTLRLNVRDVLWSQRVKGEARFGNIDAAFQQFNDSRVATISFTYRINKGKVNGNGSRRKTGASEEQERVQPSN